MLAGQNNTSGSMFDSLMPKIGPTSEELDTERQRVMVQKHVKVKGHYVRIFDMHVAKDVKAYEKLMKELIEGSQVRTHMIWANDRQLVTRDGNQYWLRYLEWSLFELKESATPPVGIKA